MFRNRLGSPFQIHRLTSGESDFTWGAGGKGQDLAEAILLHELGLVPQEPALVEGLLTELVAAQDPRQPLRLRHLALDRWFAAQPELSNGLILLYSTPARLEPERVGLYQGLLRRQGYLVYCLGPAPKPPLWLELSDQGARQKARIALAIVDGHARTDTWRDPGSAPRAVVAVPSAKVSALSLSPNERLLNAPDDDADAVIEAIVAFIEEQKRKPVWP